MSKFSRRFSYPMRGFTDRTNYLLLTCLLLILQDTSAGKPKILLNDIETLTFHDGRYTDYRRVSPVEQLKCVGGTAAKYKQYRPHAVQCYNTGFDGRSVQWRCNAELSKAVRFGKLDVNCEGYDFPEDRYVLTGSCALRYELDFKKESSLPDLKSSLSWLLGGFGLLYNLSSTYIAVIAFLAVVFAVWYFCIPSTSEFGPVPRAEPTAPPYTDNLPSYEEAMRDGGRSPRYPGESFNEETRFRGHSSSTSYGWNLPDSTGYTGDPGEGTSFWSRWRKPYHHARASNGGGGSSNWATGASAFAGSFLGSSLFGSRGCSRNYDFDQHQPRRSAGWTERRHSSSEERDTYVSTGYATSSGR